MTSAWIVNCLIVNLVADVAGICYCMVGTAHLNGRRQGNLGLLLAVGLLVPVVPLLMAAVTFYWYSRQTAGITPGAQDVIDRCRAAAAEGYHTALVSPAVMDTLCQGFVPGEATRGALRRHLPDRRSLSVLSQAGLGLDAPDGYATDG